MPTAVQDSVLQSIKKLLGISDSYTIFDIDVQIHINSVFMTLQQLGICNTDGTQYSIDGSDDTWDSIINNGNLKNIEAIKTYIYMRVRIIFDPFQTGFATTSFDNQIKEMEWRLMISAASSPNVLSTTPVNPGGGTVDPEQIAQAVADYIQAHPVADGVTFNQTTPATTWTWTHNLGRVPVVAVFVNGQEVDAAVTATDTTVTVEFPQARTGTVVLT